MWLINKIRKGYTYLKSMPSVIITALYGTTILTPIVFPSIANYLVMPSFLAANILQIVTGAPDILQKFKKISSLKKKIKAYIKKADHLIRSSIQNRLLKETRANFVVLGADFKETFKKKGQMSDENTMFWYSLISETLCLAGQAGLSIAMLAVGGWFAIFLSNDMVATNIVLIQILGAMDIALTVFFMVSSNMSGISLELFSKKTNKEVSVLYDVESKSKDTVNKRLQKKFSSAEKNAYFLKLFIMLDGGGVSVLKNLLRM